jgi:hypothetical protein
VLHKEGGQPKRQELQITKNKEMKKKLIVLSPKAS